MKKSQTITLVILFIAVSIFIWIGACSDKEPAAPKQTAKINTTQAPIVPTDTIVQESQVPEQTATATPNGQDQTQASIDYTLLDGLSTDDLSLAVDKEKKNFSQSGTIDATSDKDCYLTKPGSNSKDIYMSFMLHYSDVNSKVDSLLALAKSNNLKLNFFISSNYLNNADNAETIKKIYSEGHTLGTRGDKDINQVSTSSSALYDSLDSMDKKLAQVLGENVKFKFYSPDAISERNIKLANLMGYTVTFKYSTFKTDQGSRTDTETFNGVLFQSDSITDDLVSEFTSYAKWALSEGYTFKAFTK